MVIKTAKAIDDAFIVKAVRKKLLENHRLNRLQDYYEGRHDILLRTFPEPSQPNNRVVMNYCKNISDFLTSYLVGVPVKFDAPPVILDSLNYNDNDETTQSVVLAMNTMGFGVEIFFTDSDGIPRFSSIDPRESIFVFDDTLEELLIAFIRVYPKEDEAEGFNVTVYTDKDYTQYDLSLSIGTLKAVGQAQPHYFQDVPVIMYPNNKERIGTFEGIITLQNALNTLLSDEINDFESFANATLVLSGLQATQPEDIARMRQERVLLMDGEAKAEWLIKNVQSDHIKEIKDDITQKIMNLSGIPDLLNIGSFGASGVALRFKLLPSEILAAKQERVVQRGLQRRLELLYNIFRITDPSIGNYTDVEIEFERNFIMLSDDKLKEAQLDIQLVQDEIMSRETFLMKHKGMTLEEVGAELRRVGIEQFRVAEQTYPVEDLDEE